MSRLNTALFVFHPLSSIIRQRHLSSVSTVIPREDFEFRNSAVPTDKWEHMAAVKLSVPVIDLEERWDVPRVLWGRWCEVKGKSWEDSVTTKLSSYYQCSVYFPLVPSKL